MIGIKDKFYLLSLTIPIIPNLTFIGEMKKSLIITVINFGKCNVFAKKPDQSSFGNLKKVVKKLLNKDSSKLISLCNPN